MSIDVTAGWGWDRTPWAFGVESSTATITLQGFEMQGDYTQGNCVAVRTVTGWSDGVDGDGGPVSFEQGDGGTMGLTLLRGRQISITGIIEQPTMADFVSTIERLGALLAGEDRVAPLVVFEPSLNLERQINVTRLRAPQVTANYHQRTATFTLDLVAATYERLSTTETRVSLTPGHTGTASNDGNVDARLSAALVGPLTNPSIRIDNAVWAYSGTIASGYSRSVDFTRRVVRSPETGTHFRTNASGIWPSIPPGSHTITIGGSGGGHVDVYWRSSWS